MTAVSLSYEPPEVFGSYFVRPFRCRALRPEVLCPWAAGPSRHVYSELRAFQGAILSNYGSLEVSHIA